MRALILFDCFGVIFVIIGNASFLVDGRENAYPFTHLDKGHRNAHPFLRFIQKNFWKNFPLTCSHWEVSNYRVFMKFLSGKNNPFTYLELQSQNAPYFSDLFVKKLHLKW